jgi:hypothetical protein
MDTNSLACVIEERYFSGDQNLSGESVSDGEGDAAFSALSLPTLSRLASLCLGGKRAVAERLSTAG